MIRGQLSPLVASLASAIVRADARAEYVARPLLVQRWTLEDGVWGWVEEFRSERNGWRPQWAMHATAYRIVEAATGQMLEHWGAREIMHLASWKRTDDTVLLEQRCNATQRGVLGFNVGRSRTSAVKYARGLQQRFRVCLWTHPKAFNALMTCIDLLEAEPGATTLEA